MRAKSANEKAARRLTRPAAFGFVLDVADMPPLYAGAQFVVVDV